MSSTTPSTTRNSASFDRLQVEKGRLWSCGRERAIFLISRRSGRVKVGGRPPVYFETSDSKPSSLKLCTTARTRSSAVKAVLAIRGRSMPWALQSTIWALRHRTTDPEPLRMILRSWTPSLFAISRARTRSAIPTLCATERAEWWTRTRPISARMSDVSYRLHILAQSVDESIATLIEEVEVAISAHNVWERFFEVRMGAVPTVLIEQGGR